MWTVEWFDDQKKRQLTETSSTCQIALAQPFAPREQHKAKKRKRDVDRSLVPDSSITQDATPTSENQDQPIELGVDLDVKVLDPEREHSPAAGRALNPDEQKVEEVQAHLAEAHDADHSNDGSSTKPMGDGKHRFFLLKPRTSSSRHVLIPLDTNATLGECLNGRTVLEFPTIYVFPDSVQQLPEDFMMEEEYLKQEGEEQKEFNELISELDPEILKRLKDDEQRSAPGRGKDEEVDSKEILDVLKKDFGAVG
jgi:hypothetical protein